MGRSVVFQFVHQAQVQVAPFTGHFSQVVALLPALQAVAGSFLLALLFRRGTLLARPHMQPALEGVQQCGNVVVELRAWKRGRGGQFRVVIHGLAPRLQDGHPPRSQVRSQCRQLFISFLRAIHLSACKGARAFHGSRAYHQESLYEPR